MSFTVEDAKTVLGFISIGVIPFAVTWLKSVTWPDTYKFALAAVLSLIAGFLTAYANEKLLFSGSIIQNTAVIFGFAQLIYYGAFRGLGLERVLFPQSALAHHAEEAAVQAVSTVSREEAKAVLDPAVSPTLEVTAEIKS